MPKFKQDDGQGTWRPGPLARINLAKPRPIHWHPDTGVGIGGGVLNDVQGVVGRVSMSGALTPFPRPAG